MQHGLKQLILRGKSILPSLLPQACFLCGARSVGQQICPDCDADLPRLTRACCPQCALPTRDAEVCGDCLRHGPAFDRTLATYRYAFPLDALIQQFKYAGISQLSAFFAEKMAQRIALEDLTQYPIDYLIPMPLHSSRLAHRGYNQAAEIARRLSPQVGVPWLADACQRIRSTSSQAGLDLATRQHNLRGAFSCHFNLQGKRVALIDDVMTSGSSLNELAEVVRNAGASEIQTWVLARTLAHT
jgi:ComF family protein